MRIELDLGMKMISEVDCANPNNVNTCRLAVFNAYQQFFGRDHPLVTQRSWENVLIKAVVGGQSEEVTDDNFSRYRSVALLYAKIVPQALVEPLVPRLSS